MIWLLPLLAFAAMFPQDVLGSIMMRAEAQGRAHLAAACDTLQDACSLTSLGVLGGSALDGGHLAFTATAAAAIAGRLCADYSGTWSGVKLGVWLDRKRPATPALSVTLGGGSGDREFLAWLRKNIRPGGGGAGVRL